MQASNGKQDGIIVLGHPRSGTTLLRRMLDAHPNIACPGETHILNACARFLHAETTADGVDMGVLAGLNFAGFDDQEVLARLRELAFGFSRDYAKRQGKARWAEKTAVDAFHIDAIDRLCGDHAYFICIVRHGLDVAVSCKDLTDATGVYLEDLHRYVRRHTRPHEAFCRACVDVTAKMLEFAERHPDNCVACRYEDLIAEPAATMQALVEFVGEDWDPALLETGLTKMDGLGFGDWKSYQASAIDPSNRDRWKALPGALIGRLAGIVNPTLEACGYEPVDAGSDEDVAAARRRYKLGLMVHAARGCGN